jgi:hypothetical protein
MITLTSGAFGAAMPALIFAFQIQQAAEKSLFGKRAGENAYSTTKNQQFTSW